MTDARTKPLVPLDRWAMWLAGTPLPSNHGPVTAAEVALWLLTPSLPTYLLVLASANLDEHHFNVLSTADDPVVDAMVLTYLFAIVACPIGAWIWLYGRKVQARKHWRLFQFLGVINALGALCLGGTSIWLIARS